VQAGPGSAACRVGCWSPHRSRRRAAHAAVALGVMLAGVCSTPFVGPARAATQATLTGTISPAVNNFAARPQSVGLSILARFLTTPPGGQPATVTQAVISFSHGATINSQLFPGCSARRLDLGGLKGCPPDTRIGTGSALGVGAGIDEPLNVTAFNGPRGRSVLFYLQGNSPIHIAQAIDAPLVPVRGRFYAYQLTLPVPEDLQVIAGVPIAVAEFQTTVRATVTKRVRGTTVRRGYIEVPLCPAGALVPLRGIFSFIGAPTETVNSGIACGEPPPS